MKSRHRSLPGLLPILPVLIRHLIAISLWITAIGSTSVAQTLPAGAWVYSGSQPAAVPEEIAIPLYENITAIAAAYEHTVALKADGGVMAWGRSPYGETTIPAEAQSGVVAIAAGGVSMDITGGHTVVLKQDGSVLAWGRDDLGQSTVPTEAQSGVIAVAAGGQHTVALKSGGGVIAWGDNSRGQATVPVEAQSGVTAIAAGTFHTVALKQDGSIVTWGWNGYGLLSVPQVAQTAVIAIAAGGSHTLALKQDGSVIAWGDGSYGQSTVPTEAQSGVIAVAASHGHSVALKQDGSVVAWGWNGFGQTTVPTEAQSGITAISAGTYHTVALKADSSILSWGYGGSGHVIVPVALKPSISAVSSGYYHSMALKSDGGVVAWGKDDDGQSTVPSEALSLVTAISAGHYHSLALKVDGSVVAWGRNDSGQATVPTTALTGVTAITAGSGHSAALKQDGSVVAWGNDYSGQATVPVEAQSGVIAIAAGGSHTLALRTDGGVIAWGLNSSGQATVPAEAESGVIAIAACTNHSVALKQDGSVVAWGSIYVGETTVPPAAQSGVIAIAAGSDHTMAVKEDGSVVTWGAGYFGQATVPSEAEFGVTAIVAGGFRTYFRIKGVAEIDVEQPIGSSLSSGVSSVNFVAPVDGSQSLVFTIKSIGTTTLGEISASLSGTYAGDFSITSPPAGIVDSGSETSLTVNFTPTGSGTRTAVLEIASNDTNENPFTIVLTGNSFSTITDGDGDGLSDYDEVAIYGTDPALPDTDNDGLTDGWEVGVGRFSIIPGTFTWAEARADAHTRSGELGCFPTEDRWNRAIGTLGVNALDPYLGLWIGATDEVTDGYWIWVNGETFSFSPWATSRPSTTPDNTLDYVEVSGGDGGEIGKWYDRSATSIRDGYILETGYATNPTVGDVDNDGLNDSQEQAAGSNPFLADTDGDGLTDGQEVNLTHTNPNLKDSDDDGTNDAEEDSDDDGLNNLVEITQYATDPLDDDSDNDGLKDGVEVNYAASYFKLIQGSFTYPQAEADAASQRGRIASFPDDADYSRMASKARQTTQGYLWIGLSDAAAEDTWLWTDGTTATYSRWLDGEPSGGATENHVVIMENSTKWADTMEAFVAAGYLFERVGLDPLDEDTDGDGLLDGQEVNTTLSNPVLDDTDGDGLLDGAEVNTHGSSPLLADTDDDGLSDRVEVEVYGSNPSLKDSDGDGFEDLFEVNTGFDPASVTSTPDSLSSIRTAVEFRFNAANGVSYRIEASTDLNEWNTVETDIIGASSVVTRFYSIENQPRRYFRVRRN